MLKDLCSVASLVSLVLFLGLFSGCTVNISDNATDNVTPTPTSAPVPTATPAPTATPTPTPLSQTLFVLDNTSRVLSFAYPSALNGDAAPTTSVTGSNTLLNSPTGLVVLASGALVVCNHGSDSLTIYDNATTVTGDQAPSRTVSGAATGIVQPSAIAYDAVRDILYVANDEGPNAAAANNILVFTDVSSPAFKDNITPAWTIQCSLDLHHIFAMTVDTSRDTLYLMGQQPSVIYVYDNVTTWTPGSITPTRVISSTFTDPTGMFVDKDRNQLFVVESGETGAIRIFKNASTVTGPDPVTPDVVLTTQDVLCGAVNKTDIAVDANGTAYITGRGNNPSTGTGPDLPGVFQFDALAGRTTGMTRHDRAIMGASTRLVGPSRLFLLQTPTATPPPGAETITVDCGGGVTMPLVKIPAGTFQMGTNDGGVPGLSFMAYATPRHPVTISKPFYMGVYEVTQAQYQAVMGTNPSHFTGDLNRPVEQVSWDDAVAFCQALSAKSGRTFLLPTEAQWEYACRADTGDSTARFYFGDNASQLGNYAWYDANSRNTTHPVGMKAPNSFGLYDMDGNVYEWCNDWWGDTYYSSSPSVDPSGPPSGTDRILRGGSIIGYDTLCESAYRFRGQPPSKTSGIGFRVVAGD